MSSVIFPTPAVPGSWDTPVSYGGSQQTSQVNWDFPSAVSDNASWSSAEEHAPEIPLHYSLLSDSPADCQLYVPSTNQYNASPLFPPTSEPSACDQTSSATHESDAWPCQSQYETRYFESFQDTNGKSDLARKVKWMIGDLSREDKSRLSEELAQFQLFDKQSNPTPGYRQFIRDSMGGLKAKVEDMTKFPGTDATKKSYEAALKRLRTSIKAVGGDTE